MSKFRQFGAFATVLAFCAIGAATASASTFTVSATGELSGKALETQTFAFNGGTVKCSGADTTGTVSSSSFTELVLETQFTGCTAFGVASVHLSKFSYDATSNGTVHILKPMTITVTKTLFTGHCTATVAAQTVGTDDFANLIAGNMKVVPTIANIKYSSTGGVCGTEGENGTFSGASEIQRVGGGTIAWDA